MVSMRKPRLAFMINSLEGGGAERALANLLGVMKPDLENYDVHLILLDNAPEQQPVPGYVTKHVLDSRGGFARSAAQLFFLWVRLRPDICVSYLSRSNCLNVWISWVFRHKAIISERVQTTSHLRTAPNAAFLKKIISATYKHAHCVIAVSQGVADDLADSFDVPPSRLAVIGNPIDGDRLRQLAAEPTELQPPRDYIVAVGRLVPNKNFEMLFKAFQRSGVDLDLLVLGEGPERDRLEHLAEELGIEKRVQLPGFMRNPYPVMAKAAFLVSCSNAEGFPNTLVEAMCLGLPVAATDCPSGPFEVLRGSARQPGADLGDSAMDGILVPVEDADTMAEAIRMLSVKATRKDYAKKARERSTAFGVDAIVHQYMQVITEATARWKHRR